MDFESSLVTAAEYLKQRDHVLKPLIERYGLPAFRPHNNYYQELVESIISQQLSVKAASTITGRFVELFGHFPEPEEILARDFDELRSVGLSGQKTSYIRDLAEHVIDGRVTFDHLDALSNDEIIAEFTDVKGIGIWTVHMFLIFCMGRLDVLPVGDLGIRNGVTKLYKYDQLVNNVEIEQVSVQNHWHPYESVASWYVWKSLDNAPLPKN